MNETELFGKNDHFYVWRKHHISSRARGWQHHVEGLLQEGLCGKTSQELAWVFQVDSESQKHVKMSCKVAYGQQSEDNCETTTKLRLQSSR